MAFRMQSSVPKLTDLSQTSQSPPSSSTARTPASPGHSPTTALLRAPPLRTQGVRLRPALPPAAGITHGGLPKQHPPAQCKETDQASAALVLDLEQRGLLDDTLVIWGGEFGRTSYSQGPLTATNYGRDHHPRCFTMWLAGGGVKAGLTYGETDDFGYSVVRDGLHVHDLNALILHLAGMDHERLTYKHQGRRFRLTDVHGIIPRALLS